VELSLNSYDFTNTSQTTGNFYFYDPPALRTLNPLGSPSTSRAQIRISGVGFANISILKPSFQCQFGTADQSEFVGATFLSER